MAEKLGGWEQILSETFPLVSSCCLAQTNLFYPPKKPITPARVPAAYLAYNKILIILAWIITFGAIII